MRNSSSIKMILKILSIIFICENLVMGILANFPKLTVLSASIFTSEMLSIFSFIPLWMHVINSYIKAIQTEEIKYFKIDMVDNLNIIFKNMFEGVIVQSNKGDILFYNKAAQNILDLTDEQILSQNSHNLIQKASNEDGTELAISDLPSMKVLKSGQKLTQKIIGITRLSGEFIWISVSSIPIFDQNNPEASRVISTFQNITEQKKLIDDLGNHKACINIASKAIGLGFWDWDLIKNSLNWDDTMYSLYGIDKGNFKNSYESFSEALLPEDIGRVSEKLNEIFSNKKDYTNEFRIKKPNGEIRIIKSTGQASYNTDGKPIRLIGANWDVTEERAKELKLLYASKMSSLGEMSSGIAHEINNPLCIILGKVSHCCKLIHKQEFSLEELNKQLDGIKNTANRIAVIIKGLRSFANDDSEMPMQIIKTKTILEETLSLCKTRFLNQKVELKVNNKFPDLEIECRPTQISQVLLNLLHNAFDATQTLNEKWIEVSVFSSDIEVEFVITDSGNGIPEQIRNKLMQPFFTTKEVGHGTGLGLSISKGLMLSHHGDLILDTENRNTRFICRLPIKQNLSPQQNAV